MYYVVLAWILFSLHGTENNNIPPDNLKSCLKGLENHAFKCAWEVIWHMFVKKCSCQEVSHYLIEFYDGIDKASTH